MSEALALPGTTSTVEARSVLVLAPHYDDEVLGCGGLLAQLVATGAEVRVVFLTDGSGGVEPVDDAAAYVAARQREALAAAAVLGIPTVEHLGLPDGGLEQQLDRLAAAIEEELLAQRPDLVLVTSPLETSADHRAAFAALHRVLSAVRPGRPLADVAAELKVLAYDVNHPLYPDLLVDVGRELPLIDRAMACYESQEARHRYRQACLGLLRYRALSLPPEVEAAEGYARLTVEDFTTRSLAGLIRRLGGAPALLTVEEGPRISVVMRTRDRPELLAQALDSLAATTYRRAEVVLVNDGGATPATPEDFPLPITRVELAQNRGRAAAANAGIEAARGDAVTFLDDDDLVEPEHLATLAGLLGAAGVRLAYTDAAVGVYELDASGWTCRERRLPYSRDFDPELLLYDNYIPFHTVVLRRQLCREVGPFDEELPFFEDWDFLIRCAGRTPFHHLAQVTCEYRQFRGGGHHVLGDRPRARADFLATKARVIAKHAARITPEAAARVVDRLRAEAIAAEEEARNALRARRREEERRQRLNGELAAARNELAVAEVTRQRLEAELDGRRAELAGRDAELHRRGVEIERLGELAARRSEELARSGEEIARLEAVREERDRELERLYGRERELVAAIEEQGKQLERTYAEIERLMGLIRGMESTRAWRLHQWWQRRFRR